MSNKYNMNVRVGNWFEDLILLEEFILQYLRKTDLDTLNVIRARKLFLEMLAEVTLTLPSEGLIYGGPVQIISPDVPNGPPRKIYYKNGMALAAHIDYKAIETRLAFEEGDVIRGSAVLNPCRMNTWILEPCDKVRSKAGQKIRYGDTFRIQTTGMSPSNCPLYVDASVNSPLGPVGICGFVTPKLTPLRTVNSRFTVVHRYSQLRYETEGQIVPPFERVVILHAPTGQALSIENEFWYPTYFGDACEVTTRNRMMYRNHLKENLWTLAISAG